MIGDFKVTEIYQTDKFELIIIYIVKKISDL